MNIFGCILLLSGLILFNLLYMAVHAIVGRQLGLPLTAMTWGIGPRLWRFRLAGIETRIRLLPLTADLTFGIAGQFDALESAPWHKKAVLAASGLLAGLALAALILGREAWPLVLQTWSQVLDVFRHWGEPLGLADATAMRAHDAGVLVALGLVIAKLTAYNALPLPTFNGGRIILAIVEALVGQHIVQQILPPLLKISVLLAALVFAAVLWREFLG